MFRVYHHCAGLCGTDHVAVILIEPSGGIHDLGLFGALLTVLLLLPYFNLSGNISVTPSVWILTDKLNIWLTRLHQQRRLVFVVLSLGLVSVIVIDDINFNDDIRLLNSSPAF